MHLCNLFTHLLYRSRSTWWLNRIKGSIILRARCLFFQAIQRKTGTIYCSRYVPSLLKKTAPKICKQGLPVLCCFNVQWYVVSFNLWFWGEFEHDGTLQFFLLRMGRPKPTFSGLRKIYGIWVRDFWSKRHDIEPLYY